METEDEYNSNVRRTAEQRVGRTLARKYTLQRVLGVGGMAAVYAAAHRNGHRVAVKVLHPEISVVPDLRARFLREGYVANAVSHAGVVRVLDDDITEDGVVFLVMELLEGTTLAELLSISGGSIPAEELVPLAIQVLDVLSAAHDAGIIHRDIKPDNVFVERSGIVKLLDFGIARVAHESRTRTGRVLGTPEFMSPEQAKGQNREIDARTDLYAVGAVLFRALSGRNVHDGETPEMNAILTATERPRKLSDVAPAVASELADVVDRALLPAKNDRFPNAGTMRAALEVAIPRDRWRAATRTPSSADASGSSAQQSRDFPTAGVGGLSTPVGRRERRKRTTAITLAVVVVVIALGAFFYPQFRPLPTVSPALEPGASVPRLPKTVPTSAAPTSTTSEPPARPRVDTGLPAAETGFAAKPNKLPKPASAAPPSSSSSKATSPPPPACDPPWTLTATGTREYKLECFKK